LPNRIRRNKARKLKRELFNNLTRKRGGLLLRETKLDRIWSFRSDVLLCDADFVDARRKLPLLKSYVKAGSYSHRSPYIEETGRSICSVRVKKLCTRNPVMNNGFETDSVLGFVLEPENEAQYHTTGFGGPRYPVMITIRLMDIYDYPVGCEIFRPGCLDVELRAYGLLDTLTDMRVHQVPGWLKLRIWRWPPDGLKERIEIIGVNPLRRSSTRWMTRFWAKDGKIAAVRTRK
jgi:hypothetical protein